MAAPLTVIVPLIASLVTMVERLILVPIVKDIDEHSWAAGNFTLKVMPTGQKLHQQRNGQ